jgi:hypothetical protein
VVPLRVRPLRCRPALALCPGARPAPAPDLPRRQTCPGGERGSGGETRHIGPNLSDHHLCAGLGKPRNGVEQGDDLSFGRVLSARRRNVRRKAGTALVQTVDVGEQLGEHEALVRRQMTPQRLLELRPLLAPRPLGQLREHQGVLFARQQSAEDRASGAPHDVGGDRGQLEVGALQRLRHPMHPMHPMHPIHPIHPFAHKRRAIAGQIA